MLRVACCAWLLATLGACSAPRDASTPDQRPPRAATASAQGPTPQIERAAPAAPIAHERPDEPRASVASDTSAQPPPAPKQPEPLAPPTPSAANNAAETDAARAALRRRAIEHIENDQLAAARALLDELLTAPAIARARALLNGHKPHEALAVIEAVLAEAPGEPRALLLRAEASLRSGLLTRREESLEQAFESFLSAGAGARSRLGASRAARALGRFEDAAALAREGWEALGADPLGAEIDADETPERTVAEAHWAWFESLPASERRRAQAEPTRAALARLVARESHDSTAWLRLAHVERELGHVDAQVRTLERALEVTPGSERVAERLAQAAGERGGWTDLVATVERARTQHPENPALWLASARARLEWALGAEGDEALAQLRQADAEFERWGALTEGARESSLRERAWCRARAGWIALGAQRIDAALAQFRSVGALAPGALHWSLEGRVPPALEGLSAAARALRERGEWVEAARIWSELHAQSPEVVEWARLAGESWRTAAEQTLVLARELKLASDGRIVDPAQLEGLRRRAGIGAKPSHGVTWTLALQRAATEAQERAARWFKSSYVAFVDAAQLSPNDVRLLCDASEVAVYQLKRDLPIVREFLREALRLGELRAGDPSLAGEERRALLEAWGDAHECMGVLLLDYKREPAKAKIHFLRSVEIGPDPRPIVVETYLPQCEEAIKRTLR